MDLPCAGEVLGPPLRQAHAVAVAGAVEHQHRHGCGGRAGGDQAHAGEEHRRSDRPSQPPQPMLCGSGPGSGLLPSVPVGNLSAVEEPFPTGAEGTERVGPGGSTGIPSLPPEVSAKEEEVRRLIDAGASSPRSCGHWPPSCRSGVPTRTRCGAARCGLRSCNRRSEARRSSPPSRPAQATTQPRHARRRCAAGGRRPRADPDRQPDERRVCSSCRWSACSCTHGCSVAALEPPVRRPRRRTPPTDPSIASGRDPRAYGDDAHPALGWCRAPATARPAHRRGATRGAPRRPPGGHDDAHPGPRLRAGGRAAPRRWPARRRAGASAAATAARAAPSRASSTS